MCPNGADIESKVAGQLLVRQSSMYFVSTRFVYFLGILTCAKSYILLLGSFCDRNLSTTTAAASRISLPGVSKQDAQVALKGTTSGDKNELLFSRFDTNYNEIPQRFRKGTTLFRARPTAVVPQGPGRSQQPTPHDSKAADGADKTGGCASPSADYATSEGASGGGASSLVPVESVGGADSPVDGNTAPGLDEGTAAQAGTASPPSGGGEGDKMSGMSGKGRTTEKAKAARAGSAVVRVVSSGDGKGRTKRLLKKGHAPPGAIEEDACDLIRDDFWERNPHILARSATRR